MRDNLPFSTSLSTPKALYSVAPGTAAHLCKYLQGAAPLRCALRAAPLWAMVLSASLGAVAPAWAQAASELAGVGAVKTPGKAILVGDTVEIPWPPGTGRNYIPADTSAATVIPNSSKNTLLVKGLRDGKARVGVTYAGGIVLPYVISVGSGVEPPAPEPAANTWDPIGGPSAALPVLTGSRGGGLPAGLTLPQPPREEPTDLSPNYPLGDMARRTFPAVTMQTLQVSPSRDTGRTIRVKAGLARFLSFSRNILAVYFSNPQAMDARALTARTVAITGSMVGKSTLAVNVAQSPTDTVGRFEIFNIEVEASTASTAPTADASTTEAAIRAAIYDPRIGVSVFQGPNGALAVSLKGTLHDQAEKAAAESTAALFVPRDLVFSSLYLDPLAPTLYQVLNPTSPVSGEGVLQAKMRQITGNDTVELISLPGGLAVKATVDSPADAEALLSLLPTLNTRVLPFIVVRGQSGQSSGSVDASGAPIASSGGGAGGAGKYYGADRPILEGEDLQITRRLQEVTGIRTVSVVRTAQNALAIYGTVRNRTEYDTVKRYLVLLPLFGSGVSSVTQTRSGSSGGVLPGPGQSVRGGAGAASGAGALAPGRPQFSPALQDNPNDPFFQSQAQVAGGTGGTGGAGAGTGAVAPTGGTGIGSAGTSTGTGTGAVAPSASGTNDVPGAAGTGAFGTGTLGTGFNTGVGFVPGFGGAGFGGGDFSQIQSNPNSPLGTSSSAGGLANGVNASQQPSAGYRQDINIQMFVRILDPGAQSVRRVTVESNIVEISRTSLKNLGIEVGTVALLTRTETPGTAATAPTITINPATGQQTIIPGAPGTPGTTQATIDPSVRQGVFTAANGFIGGQGLRVLDPFRLRLNALYQNGNARILSRPNITATEGADAQIVIGGERPVPSSVATGQAVGQSIVFRRFGIILTMRPTVLDDDTIILQIRADVTELAPEYGINLNGALIPGERVRSVNTTITVRPGDTFVLGGLITNDRRQQTSRIPILSSLPIIGKLFQSKRFENNESELAIFMSPRIDRIPVSSNGQEANNRIQSLPPLPDSATGASAFNSIGSASTQ